jgi:hypothetical protein
MVTQQQTQARTGTGKEQIMVVAQGEDGFRVYTANDPGKVFDVTGNPQAPECNCPEFQWRKGRPGYRCAHIEAVFHETGVAVPTNGNGNGNGNGGNGHEQYRPDTGVAYGGNGHDGLSGASVMILKRSVSPDKRIDSLSVEFSHPLDGISPEDIVDMALQSLTVQAAIAGDFLADSQGQGGNNGQGRGQAAAAPISNDGAQPGQMLDIGGMQTRWGWRYFINVKVNGNTVKLFGKKNQLADYIATAGYPNQSGNIDKGVTLNLPCRVITQPSEDGRYVNVSQILPQLTVATATRGGRTDVGRNRF